MSQRQRRTHEEYMSQIDFIFYREKEIREAVFQKRLSMTASGALRIANVGNSPDPTATQAIRNLTPIKFVVLKSGEIIDYPERWLEVIEKTYRYCEKYPDCRAEVARRRYQGEDYRKTCAELNISDTARRRLLELVKIYAALQAVQSGLIKV